MKKTEVVAELKALGTAQNVKIYGRHGVTIPMFGVSFANLGKLKKRIGTNQALAEQLWATGNHDARVLATMVADPDAVAAKTLDTWAGQLDSYVISDAFAKFAAQTERGRKRMLTWMKARQEWKAAAGWNVLSCCAESSAVDDALITERLAHVETHIHDAKNRVRHSMNQALICMALRSEAISKKAIAAARRIGKVEVDHGETSCKTPDAESYIKKTKAHRQKKKR